MTEITIKGLHPRYRCYLNGKSLEIYNQKGERMGSKHYYNSQQTNYTLYCEDGKRRSFYEIRLMYAYTNNISVLDIPKGCIYRTKYGLEFYNKRKIIKRPLKEIEVGDNKLKYIKELDEYWRVIKDALINKDLTKVADILMSHKDSVIKRAKYHTGGATDVLEDAFQDSVEYYLKRIISPKYGMSICLPEKGLLSYTIKRYKSQYRCHEAVL